jgi:hypothetical protein
MPDSRAVQVLRAVSLGRVEEMGVQCDESSTYCGQFAAAPELQWLSVMRSMNARLAGSYRYGKPYFWRTGRGGGLGMDVSLSVQANRHVATVQLAD